MTDWEARALPSEARCRKWAELGGVWVSAADGFGSFQGKEHRTFYREPDRPMWRPWKDNNPATWSEFFSATHPPIPEGWEGVGEWSKPDDPPLSTPGIGFADISILSEDGRIHDRIPKGAQYFLRVRHILPAIPAGWEAVGEWHDTLSPCSEVYDWTLLQDGRIVQRGETFRGKDERIMGVHIRRVLPDVDWGDVPRGVELDPDKGAVMLVTSDGHAVTHGIVWFAQGVWRSAKTMEHDAQRADSLPAAIVALTGRRG